jgi:hypothetical protein
MYFCNLVNDNTQCSSNYPKLFRYILYIFISIDHFVSHSLPQSVAFLQKHADICKKHCSTLEDHFIGKGQNCEAKTFFMSTYAYHIFMLRFVSTYHNDSSRDYPQLFCGVTKVGKSLESVWRER